MSTPAQRGARVQAHRRAPSVDLVRLVELLTKAIKADTAAPAHPVSWPLFNYDGELKRLRVNTRGVLSRLYQSDEFKNDFRHGENLGFLRDVALPNRGLDARMGGRVVAERLPDLARATTELKHAVKMELHGLLGTRGVTIADLVVADARRHLSLLAERVGASFQDGPTEAAIVPIQFVEPARTVDARQSDIARLIAAVEEVESRDWLDNFEGPARRTLARRGLEEDEIDGALSNVRREAAKLDSQVIRFLNFLDDEALARVRLAVTFAIIGAIKEAAK